MEVIGVYIENVKIQELCIWKQLVIIQGIILSKCSNYEDDDSDCLNDFETIGNDDSDRDMCDPMDSDRSISEGDDRLMEYRTF